ncbi:hypothetical protein HanOQP8_Chr17g0672521 [Helianthus annuus]|nr:hypothetical protein HanOQP8_Chr17g0672521 [Helianthus annuus]
MTQAAACVCLIMNQDYNYSKYVFEGMKRNVTRVRKDKFVMYPRFLQMILNVRYPDLERSGNTLDLKPMGPTCFRSLTPKKSTASQFEGRIPLEKFGQFPKTEEVVAEPENAPVNVPINVVVAEEHNVQIVADEEPEAKFQNLDSDDEGIVISYDGDEDELPLEAEVSTIVSTVQPVISAESLALLLKSVSEKIGNLPFDSSLQSQEPVNEDPKDSDSQPLKQTKRDPRPGVVVEQIQDQPVIDEDDDGLYDFDFETAKATTETTFEFETTATTTETLFEFETTETRMDVDPESADVSVSSEIPVSVSAPPETPVTISTPLETTTVGSSSAAVHDEPCSSSGIRHEERLKLPFVNDSSDGDEFISVQELKKRIVVLEQDSIHKDAKIIQLEDTIVEKNQQIDQLQGDVGLLFSIVYDICGKLEKKFGQEFADPTDTEKHKKAAEDRARAFAKDDAERGTTMDLYFRKPVDKEKAKRLKQEIELVVVKNRNLNPTDHDVQVTHHLMDVGESHYDMVGNKSVDVSWGFDHDRKMWWIKRKIGPVEYYSRPAQFQTMTKVDLTMLSNAPYTDDKPGGRGYLFFERLKRDVVRGFPFMHTAESILTPSLGVLDPRTNRRMKIVTWPPTNKEKTIPLVKKIPDGSLKTMHFWAYDETLGQALIVCDDDVKSRLTDQVDLLNLNLENLEVLAQNQIRSTEKYEGAAKQWTAAVAGALHVRKKGFGGYQDKLGGSGSS